MTEDHEQDSFEAYKKASTDLYLALLAEADARKAAKDAYDAYMSSEHLSMASSSALAFIDADEKAQIKQSEMEIAHCKMLLARFRLGEIGSIEREEILQIESKLKQEEKTLSFLIGRRSSGESNL